MDLLKSFSGGSDKPKAPAAAPEAHHGGGEKHSSTELLASAKTVAEAARSAASGGVEKVDKGKAAGAASDLLDAAADHGKLAEKGYGSYVDKAQGYLHQYEAKEGPPKAKPSDAGGDHHDHDQEKKKKEEASGGAGDYLNMAKGFLGKN